MQIAPRCACSTRCPPARFAESDGTISRRVDGAEALLVIVVAALALFIGTQVARRPAKSSAALASTSTEQKRQRATASVDNQAGRAEHADVASNELTSTTISAPARDIDAIRSAIAAATNTYIADVLDASKGQLVRWPDRTVQPLRVWMQPATNTPGSDPRLAPMARDAFGDWLDGTIPIRFDFVLDSATSDIHVSWIDRFPATRGLQVGYTQRATDQYGWIANANIVIALHDSTGNALTGAELAGAIRHEVGHALGLGHARNPQTLMFPSERVTDIRPLDRATLRLLYSLPPGPAR